MTWYERRRQADDMVSRDIFKAQIPARKERVWKNERNGKGTSGKV